MLALARQTQLSGMGSNMIIIRPNSNISAGARLDATTVQTLTLDDIKALQKQAPDNPGFRRNHD